MSEEKDVSDFDLAQVVGVKQQVLDSRELTPREKIVHEMTAEEKKSSEFLSAWKTGIAVVGESYFSISSKTVDEATSVWELKPDIDAIEQALPAMSNDQGHLVIAMCQFYSDIEIQSICVRHRIAMPSLAAFANLDDWHRSILIKLMNSYTGW